MRGHAWTLGVLGASGAYLAAALTFPFGSVARPGPGFFPVGVGVFLCGVAAVLVVATLRRGALTTPPSTDAAAGGRVLTTVLSLVGFCLFLPWIGYIVCAFVFVALLLRRLGGAGWPAAVITAALSAFVSYYAFGVVLGVPLPLGPF
jgi:putative tricarboxylic transport membrane protein